MVLDAKQVDEAIMKINTKDFDKRRLESWKAETRLIINNFSPSFVWCEIERICEDIANEQWSDFELPTEEKLTRSSVIVNKLGKKISEKIKITDLAEKYGLKLKGTKCVCPFHLDTDPSLSFSNEKGCFNCFGCGAKGDIIEFVRRMEEIKNGKK